MSPTRAPSVQPISSHTCCGSGSGAVISEESGPEPRGPGGAAAGGGALAEPAVDTLALDGVADVVDGGVRLAVGAPDGVRAGLARVRVGAPDQAARHPAAVPARGPEPGDLALADDDPHVRLGAGQVV